MESRGRMVGYGLREIFGGDRGGGGKRRGQEDVKQKEGGRWKRDVRRSGRERIA